MDAKDIEKKWQELWKKDKVFEPKVNSNKEKFFATVPYPYANSAMHIGHGRGYTTPDIYIRYQRLKGKNVLFPLGYHISGTPVLAVADGISRGDKKQIEVTRAAISDYVKDTKDQDKIIESFKEPMNIANFFSDTIEKSLDAVGISIDWSRQFSTGDPQYSKFIEWQFKKLHEAGILVQGKYPILYSYIDENAVGEDDIKDGDTDKVSISQANYILFKLTDSDEYLVAVTLRPDAIFGATNMWVNPDMTLKKLEVNGKIWIVAKEAVVKITHQFDSVKELGEFSAADLLNKHVIAPIIDKKIPVVEAKFIDPRHGTGIVYSSPGGSPDDYINLQEAKQAGKVHESVSVINIVDHFDKQGNIVILEPKAECPAASVIQKYAVTSSTQSNLLEKAKQELYKLEHYGGKLNENCGEFKGLPVKFAKTKVQEKIAELELGGEFLETSRRAETRAGNEVIVANLDGQWFLDYSKAEIKEKAYALLDSMVYNPHKMKATQKGYLEWVQMRPCARKRGIGTRLPFDKDWVIESLSDSTIYQMYYLIAHIITRENISADQLTQELFDFIYLDQGSILSVSENTRISEEIISEMKEQINYWHSFDFRYTAGAHLSNHLSFLIYHYALIFPKILHPKCVTVGGMLIKDGYKISKSKGNGVPLIQVKEKYGVDLYRLYIAVGANYDIEMDFRDEEIFQLEKKLNRWKDVVGASLACDLPEYDSLSQTNKWLISRFYTKVTEYFEMFDALRMRESFVGILYEFLNDISYHERRTSIEETLKTIRFIAEDYITLMSPAIPHICEEYYSKLHPDKYVSLAVFKSDYKKYIDTESEDIEAIVQELISSISRAQLQKKIDSISKISLVQATDQKFALFDDLQKMLSETRDIKKIFGELNVKYSDESKFIQKFVPKTLGSGLDRYLAKKEEKEFIESVIPFLEKEFNCSCEIVVDSEKAKTAIPGRLAIVLE